MRIAGFPQFGSEGFAGPPPEDGEDFFSDPVKYGLLFSFVVVFLSIRMDTCRLVLDSGDTLSCAPFPVCVSSRRLALRSGVGMFSTRGIDRSREASGALTSGRWGGSDVYGDKISISRAAATCQSR